VAIPATQLRTRIEDGRGYAWETPTKKGLRGIIGVSMER